MTLQSFKNLTEQIGEEVLTKAGFDSLFISDYSNDGSSSTLRYRLEFKGYLPGEPESIRNSNLRNRLYTNDCRSKSEEVKQVGVIGSDFFTRLLVLKAKAEIDNFYLSTSTAACRNPENKILVNPWEGVKPGNQALCIDYPHTITCLNLHGTLPGKQEKYTKGFLTSYFKMIKKYAVA